jgi:hypothetical protein
MEENQDIDTYLPSVSLLLSAEIYILPTRNIFNKIPVLYQRRVYT